MRDRDLLAEERFTGAVLDGVPEDHEGEFKGGALTRVYGPFSSLFRLWKDSGRCQDFLLFCAVIGLRSSRSHQGGMPIRTTVGWGSPCPQGRKIQKTYSLCCLPDGNIGSSAQKMATG